MYFKSKRVLITGGTGSFGQAATRQLLKRGAREVRIFSRDEEKQWKMQYTFAEQPVTFLLGDVRDVDSLSGAMYGVDIVFHAAALKHVPRCEYNVLQTVYTNMLGTANLIQATREARVNTVVALSSDKAVMPVNAYGMTKGLMERLFINANIDLGGYPTRYICVRYGNVIGSRGSVVPFFKKQIAAGGPVTITDERMTRFWFTLQAAVEWALQAAMVGMGGEVFVRKMPAARLVDLAAILIGDLDIEVRYIGIRPGEKIHELLISEDEASRTAEVPEGYAVLPMLPLEGIRAFYGEPEGIEGAYSSNDTLMSREELEDLLDRAGWLD